MQNNQLDQDAGQSIGNQYNADFNFKYISRRDGQENKVFDFASRVNNESLIMFSVIEGYIARGNAERGSQYKIGRVILPWSPIDSTWGLGKINNRVNFDFFRPGQEGLTGLNYNIRGNNGFVLNTFASYFYIPELNPSLDINVDKGTIDSRHPWATVPATTAQNGTDTYDLLYDVDYPDIGKILFNYSLGLNVGWSNRNFELTSFYIRKPDNTISIAAKPQIDEDFASNTATVKVEPGIFYNDVVGATARYKNRGFSFYGSVIASYPDGAYEGDVQFYNLTNYKHVKIKEEYGGIGMSKTSDRLTYGANYLARRSAFEKDADNILQELPRWNESVNIFAKVSFNKFVTTGFDVKYDLMTFDRLFSFNTAYLWNKHTKISFGFDIIGASDRAETFWSPFRNNDSVYSKLHYVF
ncbi:MAG: hypothetical protein JNM93_07115 [Bacteriovoracaceae bacterium]|nr:hypothetical protein [Bacteriovoracaceae bacterium]